MNILDNTAVELSQKIKQGEIKVLDAVEAVFAAIEEKEGQLHCYITLEKEKAVERAWKVQKQIEEGSLTAPLAGVPFAIKDNLCTRGIKTTCGSKMLQDFEPPYNAEAVTLLEKAGAVIIGKTNMDEFAMGSTTETSYYGVTRNPHNTEHVPGGSSGGSAAAVAAGECFAALGSDTGGSVRLPASYCGVVGMKPTYGTVSRYGLVAYASSLDQVGVITKDVTDCAAVLETIASYDAKDSTSVKRQDTDFASGLTEDIEGMRIGIPREYLGEGLREEVKKAVLEAAEVFRGCGAIVEEFDLGLAEYVVPAYYTIAAAEASSNLGRFDGVKYGYRAKEASNLELLYQKSRSEGFGKEVKRRIMLGSFVLSAGYYDAYYLKALRVRTLIKRAFDKAFAKYDLILGPTAPATAPKLGESLENPIRMYLGDIYTVPANLAGLPAISLPTGTLSGGRLPEKSHAPDGHSKLLPIGIQLMGDCFQEKKLLGAAYAFFHH
ncbi:MAG: Asp-tRNA(Asn)/Glu-tRNA(Gln) amidotransferase subunit GatA [Bacteroidales bacterium]|nr:Asp-tRNA(Asn)/Glu-tRNA(Gln) amidotransferase subunit GatA [Lachnoclostridium sp.]MCM1385575.1 Asp-tRNA(Asn)/Glu-tRNA(Gln) amidotransferase subunit GatA [Lachnoclostridium sp.]MCM1465576.1 Asp-tRNA(Asn)/Glu-tRNA(Gln) amidotransferase subunit GatA [Bacteroidales bacterium]